MKAYLNQLYFIVACIAAHYLFGWVWGLAIAVLVSGFVFEHHALIKTSIFGGLLNSVEIIYTIVKFPEETTRLLETTAAMTGDIAPDLILTVSILIPTFSYGIAAFFSANVASIKRKITS